MLNSKVQVGDIMYPAYCPALAGVVVAKVAPADHKDVNDPKTIHGYVIIQTPTGKRVDCISPKRYLDLVEEHERKAAKFRAIYNALGAVKDQILDAEK